MPAKVVQAAFSAPKDVPGAVDGDKPSERYIYKVTAVERPQARPEFAMHAKAIATSLQTAYADDVIGEYIAQLEADYGVTINQAAVNQVVGGEPGS